MDNMVLCTIASAETAFCFLIKDTFGPVSYTYGILQLAKPLKKVMLEFANSGFY